jgi:3',5'-cyclic AMP phosphodiesterase CpdA
MRVAHFSDMHALSLDGARPWQWLSKRLPGYLNVRVSKRYKHSIELFAELVDDLNRVRPDHVIVTGDLTSLSLDAEFELARRQLDRIALGPRGVTVVPGNHDVYTIDAMVGRSFWRAFEPYAAGDSAFDQSWPQVRVRGELAVIGVSTARPSPVPLADGWVGRQQLEAIERALAEHAGKFRVLALHHPPYKNRVALLRGLRDRDALCAMLGRAGCELVLHGHEHRDVRREVGGIPVIGVGSGSYDDHRPERRARYNLYTIEGGALTAVETRVHDPKSHTFLPVTPLTTLPS